MQLLVGLSVCFREVDGEGSHFIFNKIILLKKKKKHYCLAESNHKRVSGIMLCLSHNVIEIA